MPRYRCFSASDRGRRYPLNEDSVGHTELPGGGVAAAVADGVGGRPGGACASRLAVQGLLAALGEDAGGERLLERLSAAALAANAAVRRGRREHAGYEEMATTLVAFAARDDEAALLSVGDSRAYLWRDSRLQCLTRDDTVAEQMLADGTLSAADLARSPYQHVLTRALGMADHCPVTAQPCPLRPGDLLLLCSDGLNKALSDGEIAAVLASAADAAAVGGLIAAANEAGGADNVTVLLIRLEES